MRPLHIAILSKIESATVSNELVPLLIKRGHQVEVIDMSTIPLSNFLSDPKVQSLLTMDLIYYRSGLSPDLAAILEQHLRLKQKTLINLHFSTHPYADEKSYETVIAQQHNLLVPITLYDPSGTYHDITACLGEKFIAKPNTGARGENVQLIQNKAQWDIHQTAKPTEYIYQSFIPHDFEYRVHVLGGEAVAMYKRTPPAGDFRSNVSQGGHMAPAEEAVRDKLTEAAEKVAALFDFEIMAVDFMCNRDTNELVFTEINLNPGWELSDQQATNVDLSLVTAEYFEQLCS